MRAVSIWKVNGSKKIVSLMSECSFLPQRQYDAEREHPILWFKAAQPLVLPGDGPDTAAAVAMAITTGNGQTVLHGNLTGIGIFDFKEELVQTDAAVKLHPSVGLLKFSHSMKGIFQTVGQQGAQLGICK